MSSRNVIPLALVGYGNIARKHLEVFRVLGCEFIAACNRSQTGRAKALEEGGIQRTYGDIATMLEKERPAGVICCASYYTMFEAAKQLLPYGIPTLIEKPPGLSLEEAVKLDNTASESGTPAMVAVNRRHYSVFRKAIDDAGGKDSITAVSVEWSETPSFFIDRGDPREAVERLIFANTMHALDTIVHFAGEIPEPEVLGVNRGDPFRWQMMFQGVSVRGVMVSFVSTWDSPAKWRMSFCSRGRKYEFAPLETCRVLKSGSREVRTIEPDDEDKRFKPGFYHQAQEFLRLIRSGETGQDYSIASIFPAFQLAEQLTSACLMSDDS